MAGQRWKDGSVAFCRYEGRPRLARLNVLRVCVPCARTKRLSLTFTSITKLELNEWTSSKAKLADSFQKNVPSEGLSKQKHAVSTILWYRKLVLNIMRFFSLMMWSNL